MKQLCLHIGCGKKRMEPTSVTEWVNIDIVDSPAVDKVMDVKKLDYDKETVDQVYMPHIIEDFDNFEADDVLKECYRVLKPGGTIKLELVDLESCAKMYLSDDPERKRLGKNGFYGSQEDPNNKMGWHKFGYDQQTIREKLEKHNFLVGKIYHGGSHYEERDIVVEAVKKNHEGVQ